MQHMPIRAQAEMFPPEPIQPWEYVRLRRQAAGLTIEQAARPFYHRAEHRADVEKNLRKFEEPGFRMKDAGRMNLDRAFPFDPAIYHQLAELDARDHPRLCRSCGWDEWTPEVDLEGDDVRWSESDPHSCSRCEQKAARRARS